MTDSNEQSRYNELWENEWRDLHKVGPGIRTRNRILLHLVRKYVHEGSILDAGCGDGSLLQLIYRDFTERLVYEGGDISNQALQDVKAFPFIGDVYVFDLEDKETLPDKHYTAVVSAEVLEHIRDWKKALGHLAGMVIDGGYLFLCVPVGMKYWSRHDDFAHHYRRFEPGQIEDELKALGFEVKDSRNWGWPVYWLYYTLLLKRIPPRAAMHNVRSFPKFFVSALLYYLFFIDDLFSTKMGRRLFIAAKKIKV